MHKTGGNHMKKIFKLFLCIILAISLFGCNNQTNNNDESIYNVAIIKQLDHPSLEEIANAIASQLEKLSKENNIKIKYIIDSGNNDPTTLQQYASSYLSNKIDVIVPIATLAAQTMVSACQGSDTKIIYAAISDPEGAQLVNLDNVSGTSDALNTKQIMDMMFTINPNIKNVGLLYSQSEVNSEKPIKDAKTYLDNKGIKYIDATGNNDSEVAQAVSSLIASGVDAIFTPTDNVIMASEITTAEKLIAAGIPHYTGADSFVRNGGFVTCGVNYTDLGYKTADLVVEALLNGMNNLEDYYVMEGGFITVNTETAKALNIDYSSLSNYGSIIEVETTED